MLQPARDDPGAPFRTAGPRARAPPAAPPKERRTHGRRPGSASRHTRPPSAGRAPFLLARTVHGPGRGGRAAAGRGRPACRSTSARVTDPSGPVPVTPPASSPSCPATRSASEPAQGVDNRLLRRYRGRDRVEDRVEVDSMVGIQIGNAARLSEVVDAERIATVSCGRSDPVEGARMGVGHGDEARSRRERIEQPVRDGSGRRGPLRGGLGPPPAIRRRGGRERSPRARRYRAAPGAPPRGRRGPRPRPRPRRRWRGPTPAWAGRASIHRAGSRTRRPSSTPERAARRTGCSSEDRPSRPLRLRGAPAPAGSPAPSSPAAGSRSSSA